MVIGVPDGDGVSVPHPSPRYYRENRGEYMKCIFSVPSPEGIRERMSAQRFTRTEYLFLLSLVVFAFIPSINQLIVDRLVVEGGTEVLDIAGQIEWFDLFNETILAFLTVPMYFVLNRARNDSELSSRINTTFVLGFVAYSIVSVIIYLYASNLAAYMSAPEESVNYLRLETIGFILGFIGSYLYVVFVVRGKWKLFVTLLIAKIVMLSIGNLMMIPENGVIGIAQTNICVNIIIAVASALLLFKEGLMRKWSGLDRDALKDWVKTGLFSGGQVFIANLIYVMVVMKMVADVSQMSDYWLANNFIWGWLIVPVAALGDMLKREFYNGYKRIWNYLALTFLFLIIWLFSVPLWEPLFTYVIEMEDPSAVLNILYKSVPFYVAYALSVIIQSVLISVGKTNYIFYECLFVNFVYYGIVYGLFLVGVFTASMDFIILMFGIGLVVCLVIDTFLYLYSKKDIPSEYQ